MNPDDTKETTEVYIDNDLKELFEATFVIDENTYSEILEKQIHEVLKSIGYTKPD